MASENLDNPKRVKWSGVEWSGVAGMDYFYTCTHIGLWGRVGMGIAAGGTGMVFCVCMWVVDALASAALTG